MEEILADAQSVELEVGCGNGHFLVERAQQRPDSLLVGVELRSKRCLKALQKVARRGIHNVVICRGRAEELLRLLPDGRLAAVHVYFPDPWPKSKHRRRRFLNMAILEELGRVLSPGGLLAFATDFFDYFVQARVLLAASPLFEFDTGDLTGAERSLFGSRFLSAGTQVHATWARRTGTPLQDGVDHD